MSLRPRRVDFNEVWKLLHETAYGVITCDRVQRSVWNERFSDVYSLCVAYPEPLGERLYTETKSFLEEHVTKLHSAVAASTDAAILSVYYQYWQQYSEGASYLDQLYRYLNLHFINKQKVSEADLNYGGFGIELNRIEMLEIGELALDIWKHLMIDNLKTTLISLILQEIDRDRKGGQVAQSVLHGVIMSFVYVEKYKKKNTLKLYENNFEKEFLREAGEYYSKEAEILLSKHSCSEYMEKVIQRIDDECLRSVKFLHQSTHHKIVSECQQRLITDHIEVMHSEAKDMILHENTKDLSSMYRLLSSVSNGLSVLIEGVEERIRNTGLESIKGLKGDNIPSQFVESLLAIHSKFSELIKSVFAGDQQFTGALDRAMVYVINYRQSKKMPCKSPELVAKFCDTLLKKSMKGVSEIEIDDKLSNSVVIFKYLDDKDIYQRFYARMLARRLIYSQSQSMEAEEMMINRLKQACGYEFTNKLHRMFTDMTISGDLQSKFSSYLQNEALDLGINFSVLVLQAGAWPIGSSNLATFSIPQELERCVKTFEMFYNKSFNGRKLSWMHNFCNAELRVSYLKKPYFITMGTYHMGILLPFNHSLSLTFKEILSCTQLPEDELIKQLQTLVDTKLITTRETINSDSVFNLNMSYSNKRTKFKVTATSVKESPQEIDQTHHSVDEDRKMFIQAAIVRIMKARKRFRHSLLIQEVISQSKSRFSPSIAMIKKCIEALIDKQYLERTPNSSDEYDYIA